MGTEYNQCVRRDADSVGERVSARIIQREAVRLARSIREH